MDEKWQKKSIFSFLDIITFFIRRHIEYKAQTREGSFDWSAAFVSYWTLIGILSNFRLTHIKREAFMTWHNMTYKVVDVNRTNSYSKFCQRKWLSAFLT